LLLAALSAPVVSFAGTFANGDFELPGGATLFLSGSADTSVTGWIYNSHGSGFESYSLGSDYGIVPDSGSHYITFGHSGATGGSISQTFDTIAGHTYIVNYMLILQQVGAQITQSVNLAAFNALDLSSLNSTQTDFDYLTWAPGNALSFTAASTSSTIIFTDLTSAGNSGPLNWDLDSVTVTDTSASGTAAPEPRSLGIIAAALAALATRYRRSRL
jgi:hypothetical protein